MGVGTSLGAEGDALTTVKDDLKRRSIRMLGIMAVAVADRRNTEAAIDVIRCILLLYDHGIRVYLELPDRGGWAVIQQRKRDDGSKERNEAFGPVGRWSKLAGRQPTNWSGSQK